MYSKFYVLPLLLNTLLYTYFNSLCIDFLIIFYFCNNNKKNKKRKTVMKTE